MTATANTYPEGGAFGSPGFLFNFQRGGMSGRTSDQSSERPIAGTPLEPGMPVSQHPALNPCTISAQTSGDPPTPGKT